MYQIIQEGKIIGNFQYFVDAWLYALLEVPTFSWIVSPENDVWVVTPPHLN